MSTDVRPDPLAFLAEELDDLPLRELGVDEDHVAGTGGVPVLRAVHPLRPPLHPLREAERDEVVDHRRAEPATLRRVHPVAEVEDVECPEDALDRGTAEIAPDRPDGVCGWQHRQAQLDVDPAERRLDRPPTAARR